NILLRADGAVQFSAGGDVLGGGAGNVTVEAGANGQTLSMSDGTVIDPGSGANVLTGGGDVRLGGLRPTRPGDAAVTITSLSGAVTDGGDSEVDVQAQNGELVIAAAAGVGTGDPLETDVESLNIRNMVSGDIQI